jgi:hypothetical protein
MWLALRRTVVTSCVAAGIAIAVVACGESDHEAAIGAVQKSGYEMAYWLGPTFQSTELRRADADQRGSIVLGYGEKGCEPQEGSDDCASDLVVSTIAGVRPPKYAHRFRCWHRVGTAAAYFCRDGEAAYLFTGSQTVRVSLLVEDFDPRTSIRSLRRVRDNAVEGAFERPVCGADVSRRWPRLRCR